jgi:hypothetical protein
MNAPANLPAPSAVRHDGWTADRRRLFLEGIADGHTVASACARVGLSSASAYALRRRDRAFALGWSAACLLARDALADILTSRAIDGQVDTYTRADGTVVTRHRHDNRLGQAMLARLDRLAEIPAGSAIAEPAEAAAARAVAGDFDPFLDLVGADAAADALDAFVEQRIPRTSQLRQLRDDDDPDAEEEEDDDEPVWYDNDDQEWHTSLPPPPRFKGEEFGTFGEHDYWRTLTPAEQRIADAREDAAVEVERAAGELRRAAWFGPDLKQGD